MGLKHIFAVFLALLVVIYGTDLDFENVNQSLVEKDKKALAKGTNSDDFDRESLLLSDKLGDARKEEVKKAMQHVWKNYKELAWGKDALKPISGKSGNVWGGYSVMILDSLDTLWIMGMKEEFDEAKAYLKKRLSFNKNSSTHVSYFETIIRSLGGLLSAYSLSKDSFFLDMAQDLGDRLLNNIADGMPQSSKIRIKSGSGGRGGSAVLAEVGTLQVEFKQLTYLTGNPKYSEAADGIIKKLDHANNGGYGTHHGLFGNNLSTRSGKTGQHISFGAAGDSYYESLIKVWLQTNKDSKSDMYLRLWRNAVDSMTSDMLQRSSDDLLFLPNLQPNKSKGSSMEHLTCFMPGVLALSTQVDTKRSQSLRDRDLMNAKALGYTCWQMYERTKSGCGAERTRFKTQSNFRGDSMSQSDARYLLRPEVIEGLFYLHEVTGNPTYREWGWAIFQSIEKYGKTKYGYAEMGNVNSPGSDLRDTMETFFTAETLKYLYLIQDPNHEIKLDRYVFNTEAHPVEIWKKDDEVTL
eukprot:TRINITY_DN352_c1_g1_i1.p1 TRINITY_DN352_c1_g1~~TRINITY_DN352_c1_g1_i1.p1  ORF type:complete len:523 (+),score=142.24 TRINITY_DN352_c1_g1_i1:123-1691(+)